MTFSVGSLVRARGREWVVLPESEQQQNLLVLRPLGGSEDEVTGIYLPLEKVEEATFALPDPRRDLGSGISCGLLRDAIRLGFRSGAGPFRSLGHIAIEPRPYQLVPLLMALRQDPVRLLIADDVGIGKTVEACLIAREFIDRGEAKRLCVLCPPHLAEQWQRALRNQFHVDAVLVLAGTAAKLERELGPGESLFDRHLYVVVSMDYIKSERRRHEFLRTCPEFVIVDEAHTCVTAALGRAAQQRHELLSALMRSEQRHLVLVTATPHSGNEAAFRSLLSLLDASLGELPEDLSGDHNRKYRETLAQHFVQRRRGDLDHYLDAETPFPKRLIAEEHYTLAPEYRKFFDRILAYCRERLLDDKLEERHQRVRWWSALALLRSLGSSPAAAAETLRNRAANADVETIEQADEIGRQTILDLGLDETEVIDVSPGSQTDDETGDDSEDSERQRLLRMARDVEKLAGAKDLKLQRATELLQKLIKEGSAPIVFCRFIPTAEYVAEHLRKALGKSVTVDAVTGELPPEERERRVEELGQSAKRVLVCTDCLSEGINLQGHFDAVVHYDLSWNPTRHEQREGRVDRYGQPRDTVRTLTYYGEDNPIDGIVLQVLLRKHKAIHKQLGVIVPIPMDTNVVVEAIFESLLLREKAGASQYSFDFLEPHQKSVSVQWDAAVEREKKSRSLFAQQSIKVEEVAMELEATRGAIGDEKAVQSFTTTALRALGATVSGEGPVEIGLQGVPTAVRDTLGEASELQVGFTPAQAKHVPLVTRTHPLVSTVASYVIEAALDPELGGPGRRCGVIRTSKVSERTTLLLLRLRFHIVTQDQEGVEKPLLAEDQVLVGFAGSPSKPNWLSSAEAEALLGAKPEANVLPEAASAQIAKVVDAYADYRAHLDQVAKERGKELLEAHRRVRQVTRQRVRALRVEPHLPGDLLGIYVYLPVLAAV